MLLPTRRAARADFYCYVYATPHGFNAVAFADAEYPSRVAFGYLAQLGETFARSTGGQLPVGSALVENCMHGAFRGTHEAMLAKFQDPAEADQLTSIMRQLDETKLILVRRDRTPQRARRPQRAARSRRAAGAVGRMAGLLRPRTCAHPARSLAPRASPAPLLRRAARDDRDRNRARAEDRHAHREERRALGELQDVLQDGQEAEPVLQAHVSS